MFQFCETLTAAASSFLLRNRLSTNYLLFFLLGGAVPVKQFTGRLPSSSPCICTYVYSFVEKQRNRTNRPVLRWPRKSVIQQTNSDNCRWKEIHNGYQPK